MGETPGKSYIGVCTSFNSPADEVLPVGRLCQVAFMRHIRCKEEARRDGLSEEQAVRTLLDRIRRKPEMINRKIAILSSAGLLVIATACGQSADTVQKKTESTTQTSEGSTKTTTETRQVGTTLEAKSETKVDTPSGTMKAKTETFVGTVTVFTAGKKLEVMTGEKKMNSFNLDEKDVTYSIDGTVAVGKRVTVIDETGDDKVRRITVKLGS
jgi:hypothetical protein